MTSQDEGTTDAAPEWVRIGVLTKPVGVKGELAIHLDNPNGETLAEDLVVRLEPVSKRAAPFEKRITRVFAGGAKLAFEGVATRDDAEKLKGAVVFARRADFADADDDELYLVDLVGARVVTVAGVSLGVIAGFSDNGAQPLALVDDGTRTVEMPFAPGLVTRVDEVARVVVVDPPEGLFAGDALVDERGPLVDEDE